MAFPRFPASERARRVLPRMRPSSDPSNAAHPRQEHAGAHLGLRPAPTGSGPLCKDLGRANAGGRSRRCCCRGAPWLAGERERRGGARRSLERAWKPAACLVRERIWLASHAINISFVRTVVQIQYKSTVFPAPSPRRSTQAARCRSTAPHHELLRWQQNQIVPYRRHRCLEAPPLTPTVYTEVFIYWYCSP